MSEFGKSLRLTRAERPDGIRDIYFAVLNRPVDKELAALLSSQSYSTARILQFEAFIPEPRFAEFLLL